MLRHAKLFFITFLFAALAAAQQKPATRSTAAHHSDAKSSTSTPLPSEDVVNAFLKQTFGYDSAVSWKINHIRPSEAEGLAEVDVTLTSPQGTGGQKFYVTEDGQHALAGDILPFGAHPYDAAQKELEKGVNGPSRGPASAPVTVVEFGDFQCPHCKDAQPTVDKLISENKNARLIFQSFPLPMHDWAMKAASYGDCVARANNDAFWKFVSGVYGVQSDITASNADEKLALIADNSGVKGSDIAACAAKPDTGSRVQHSVDLGTSLGVNSTPTLFINGRKLTAGGIPYEVLVKLVDFAATHPN
jgi:protein-disulfide isomerase